MNKQDIEEIIGLVVGKTMEVLEEKKLIKTNVSEKTAYQKAESLLYNYLGFKRIVEDKQKEIEELRLYGVPKTAAGFDYVPRTNVVSGIVTDEERVECAIRSVQESVEGTVQAISMIDKCMAGLGRDPYYDILEMYYFDGRTLEDLAVEFGCSTKTISVNKNRLVRELALRMFPDQSVYEMMH